MNELQKEYFERVAKEQEETEAAEEARLKAVMEAERRKDRQKKEAESKAKEKADRKAEEEAMEIINRVKAEAAATLKEEKEKKQTEQGPQAEDEQQEETIYEREPLGEASMPKKSPKFKKGGKKGTDPKTAQPHARPQETAATEEEKGKHPKSEKEHPKSENTEETGSGSEEEVEKMTPEAKAAADREAKLQGLVDEYQDKYKRLLAEFENARAREAKEASRMYEVGAKAVLEKLLPVVDNFERAIQTIPEEDKDRAFEQGVDKIYKQMMTVLEDAGVQPMNAEGMEFNPDLHNAVMHIEDETYGDNVVVEEMQKGYMYKDAVLRYSMVKVAN